MAKHNIPLSSHHTPYAHTPLPRPQPCPKASLIHPITCKQLPGRKDHRTHTSHWKKSHGLHPHPHFTPHSDSISHRAPHTPHTHLPSHRCKHPTKSHTHTHTPLRHRSTCADIFCIICMLNVRLKYHPFVDTQSPSVWKLLSPASPPTWSTSGWVNETLDLGCTRSGP